MFYFVCLLWHYSTKSHEILLCGIYVLVGLNMNNNISTLSFLLLLFPFLFIYFKMGSAREPQFHVLAVDDSLIDRKLIERLLKTSSYQVTTVDSGNKALEFLGLQNDQPSVSPHNHQEIKVNLIITDYCMPGMTGYDLLKKVKESSLFRNVPVVIMSSENVPSRITRCLEDGAEEFFLKPVMLSDVNKLRPVMLRAKYGQQQQRAQRSDNRRKSIEDGISPERTRLRYNGVATGLIVLLIWFLLFFGSSLSESEPGFFRNFLPFKSLLSNVLHDGEHTSR